MTPEDKKEKTRALEAALFVYGEPMSVKKIIDLLKIEEGEIREIIDELKLCLCGRGLHLIEHDGSLQLVTHPDFGTLLETIVKDELSKELSPATLETLAIVSYAGPVSRSRIDYIRGVNSSYILRNLLIRGLIERKPDPKRSNVFLYNISFDLLRHLGVTNEKHLPDFATYRGMVLKAEENLETLLVPTAPETQSQIEDANNESATNDESSKEENSINEEQINEEL